LHSLADGLEIGIQPVLDAKEFITFVGQQFDFLQTQQYSRIRAALAAFLDYEWNAPWLRQRLSEPKEPGMFSERAPTFTTRFIRS
jgi:hypothetical protein